MSVATLHTARLLLRPFLLDDAPEVARLAGDARIADTTARIPHPYELRHAIDWIAAMPGVEPRRSVWAIEPRESRELVGAIEIIIDRDRPIGTLGYWIGVPHWGLGYATEASRAVIAHGFGSLGLEEIRAIHLTRNEASGRVLAKAGLRHVGSSVDLVRDELQSVEVYAITLAQALHENPGLGGLEP